MKPSLLINLLFAFFFLLLLNLSAQNELTLKVISPSEKEVLELSGSGISIMGKITPSDSRLNINGIDAQVDIDGVFICFCPVNLINGKLKNGLTDGKFIFNLSNGNSSRSIERIYKVKLPIRTTESDSLKIDKQWEVTPSENLLVQPGDAVQVEFKATPGCRGFLWVSGLDDSIPLVETPYVNSFYWGEAVFGSGLKTSGDTIRGIYKCSFIAPRSLDRAVLKVELLHKVLGSFSYEFPGKVSTVSSLVHQVARVKYDPNLTVGRTSPGGGYKLFIPGGVLLEVIGKSGNWLKTKLSSDESVYISAYSADILPLGTPLPESKIRIIRSMETDRTVSIELGLSARLPYMVNQLNDPQKIELLVYNVTSDIDWVYNKKNSDFIKEIKHSQLKDGTLQVEIELNQKTHWGYHIEYDGSNLRLTINKPAKRNTGFLFWSNQLKGRVISVDPGHTSDNGAVGPRGTKEKDVNFDISLKLKQMLDEAGATVYLTHGKDEDLPLKDRKMKVNSFNPEISVSMHNNAVPGGVNPIEHNGSSVYYYYPQALPLAKMIHSNLLNSLKLKDFGLYWDNLYMCRIPESISLLVEPAFMIIPEQERLLKTDDFQREIARSVFDAIKTFYEEYSQ